MSWRNTDRMAAFAPADDECRTCGVTVELTYIDGQVQALDVLTT